MHLEICWKHASTSSPPTTAQSTSNPTEHRLSEDVAQLKFSRLCELVADALQNRKEALERVGMTGIRVGGASHPGPGNEGYEAYAGWYGPQHTPGIPQAELAQ
eukprot:840044-Karenia_brevis.AAC.1